MTPDPRTEEIRARMAAYPEPIGIVADDLDFSETHPAVHARLYYRRSDALPATGHPYANFLTYAPADLAYLLGRIDALEGVADKARTVALDMNLSGITSESDDHLEALLDAIESLDGGEAE